VQHLGVVEHQQIARPQQAGQIAEDAVDRRVAAPVQQARGTAFGGRMLGDQVFGQFKVEITQGENAVGRGERCVHRAWGLNKAEPRGQSRAEFSHA